VLVSTGVAAWLLSLLHEVTRSYHLTEFRRRKKLTKRDDIGAEIYRLTREYPRDHKLILPTRFGNILRGFEQYPRHVFGIEPITMWGRLTAVIPRVSCGA
jgi:hypothetical protein